MQRSSSMPVNPQYLEPRTLTRSEERETLITENSKEIKVTLTDDQHTDNKISEIKTSASCGALINDTKPEAESSSDKPQQPPVAHKSSMRPAEEEEKVTGPARRNSILQQRIISPIRRLFRRISENVEEAPYKPTTNS